MTERQLAANRRNALKSTGPRTARGKARSSRNSVKHGVLTTAPILPGIESQEAWEEHRDGVVESIAPVGYLEKLLAVQLASISWRLARVVRYEAELAAAAVATAEPDLDERAEIGEGKPSDPEDARLEAERASLILETLENLPKMADLEKLDKNVAVATLWALSEVLTRENDGISVPGIPDDDTEFDAFDNWTAGLLRRAIETYAAADRTTAEKLRVRCMLSTHEKCERAETKERDLVERGQRWKLLLERENLRRMLLEPAVLGTVTRYESNLERSFFKTLHEIQRLQAARSGAVVPPPAALDVDLTIHPEPSVETADKAFEDEITKRTQLSSEK